MEEDCPSFVYKAKPLVSSETNYAPVESLDYDLSENVVYRAQQASRTSVDLLIYSGLKWLLCLLTGWFQYAVHWGSTAHTIAAMGLVCLQAWYNTV